MFFLYTYIFKKKDEIESGGGGGEGVVKTTRA